MKPSSVSLFCGAGGETAGKVLAFRELGVEIDHDAYHAVNHWDLAVLTHRKNYPWIQVHQEDITQITAADFGLKNITLLWASPSCVHHSRARGGKPKDDQQRSHAWEVLDRWIRVAQVEVLLIENVPEFMEWGPLHTDHSEHCHAQTLADFLFRSGYMAGKNFGVKCRKKCLFSSPIKERRGEFFADFKKQLKDLGYEVEHRILCAADYGDPTIRKRFFLQAVRDGKPIRWPEASHRNPKSQPGLFDAGLPPWRAAAECIDWAIPCPSIFDRKRPLAEATLRRIAAGVMKFVVNNPKPFIVNLTHGVRLEDVEEPFKTITGANRGEKAIVVPSFVGLGGRAAQSPPRGGEQPFGTLTTKADGALIAANLVHLRGTAEGQIKAASSSVDDPTHTITSGGGHQAVVAAFLAKHYTGVTGQEMQKPLGTVTAVDHHSQIAVHLTKFNENSIGQDAEEPLHTVMAGAPRFGVVAASLIGIDNLSAGDSAAWSAEDPLKTTTTKARHAVVAAFLTQYYSTGGQHGAADAPMGAVTTKHRHALVTVTLDGQEYVLADIGMRMLEPKELATAMGFPDWYKWETSDGRHLTKRDKVKMIGNAVPVNTCKALIKAVVMERPEAFGLARECA